VSWSEATPDASTAPEPSTVVPLPAVPFRNVTSPAIAGLT
jgi:hypothetical protein